MTTESHRLGVFIIDDHPLFRRGVHQLLDMSASLCFAGEADSGQQALAVIGDIQPALILLDLHMRDMDGLTTLRALRRAGITTPVVMLTVSDQQEDVINAIRAGAAGYLLKDTAPEALLDALEGFAQHETAFDTRLTPLLAGALRRPPPARGPDLAQLTLRERDILRLLATGCSNKHIGQQLAISEGTVKVHVRHLLKKLNMRSRTEAAVWATQEGLA